jgi:hypothetical protein
MSLVKMRFLEGVSVEQPILNVCFSPQLFGPNDMDNVQKVQSGYQGAASFGLPETTCTHRSSRHKLSTNR